MLAKAQILRTLELFFSFLMTAEWTKVSWKLKITWYSVCTEHAQAQDAKEKGRVFLQQLPH